MERLLNLSLSASLIAAIRFYQRFISNRISRNCIYRTTCSHRTVLILKSEASIAVKYRQIKRQISGCKITEIISKEDNSWSVINGSGDIILRSELNEHTILDVHCTLKSFN